VQAAPGHAQLAGHFGHTQSLFGHHRHRSELELRRVLATHFGHRCVSCSVEDTPRSHCPRSLGRFTAALAARPEADDEVPRAGRGLAGVRQAVEATDPRRAAVAASADGVVGGGVRLAAGPAPDAVEPAGGRAVGAEARPSVGEAVAATPGRVADVFRREWGAGGQQPRGAGDPPGGGDAEEQLRERQRGGGR
jgi:hypothetical protein